MTGIALLTSFSRLSLHYSFQTNIRTLSTCNTLLFRATPCLWAEPLKKKKKMDPAVIRNREERKKKKIEKQIRRLEKNARQLKPIEEVEVPFTLVDEKIKRTRPGVSISAEETEARALLEKLWSKSKNREVVEDTRIMERILAAQLKALAALRSESEDLYEQAIAVDMEMVPYRGRGPMATPPIHNYDSPDGEYVDVSKKWDH